MYGGLQQDERLPQKMSESKMRTEGEGQCQHNSLATAYHPFIATRSSLRQCMWDGNILRSSVS